MLVACAILSFDGALGAVGLLANVVTISVFTPFTVFTMLAQLVFVAEDVVGVVTVVWDCVPLPFALALAFAFAFDGVPSAGNALGELELVVFAAVPSDCCFSKGSSVLSLSTSIVLLLPLLSVSPVSLVDTDAVSLSFALFVVVADANC